MANPELEKTKEQGLSQESRFGAIREVCRWLQEGEVESLTDIDEVIPKIKGRHGNVVELAIIPSEEDDFNFNQINSRFYTVRKGKMIIKGVFKSFTGESIIKKREFGFDSETHCHLREKMAYLFDQELGFDIVPPTTEREIEGQIGSLQLFIPSEVADWKNDIEGLDESKLEKSLDFFKIAIFDYILQNPDRKMENYLVSLDGQWCYAIDHGYALPPGGCVERDISGPRKILRGKEIPAVLLDKLQGFIDSRVEIEEKLAEVIIDLSGIFERTKKLIDAKKIL